MSFFKVMYISNVSWSWIKQRPQFLAEELADYYMVDVYSRKDYKKGNLVNNKTSKVKVFDLFRLPFERFSIVSMLNNFIVSYQLRKCIKEYDVIWIADPRMYTYIKKSINKRQIIVFDCMDDNTQFPAIKNNRVLLNSYIIAEKELIRDSQYVFVSSTYLANVLEQRCAFDFSDKMKVINNAIDKKKLIDDTCCVPDNIDRSASKYKIITYIGTISEWFDFELILASLKEFPNIKYYFYGPTEVVIPIHERLIYKGVLEHDRIFEAMADSDMLIMPFLLTPLIRSVNPVKLYEYIKSDVPTVAVRYSESENFSDYVYLYSGQAEYFMLLQRLIKDNLPPVKNHEEVICFLQSNTWTSRVKEIVTMIKNKESQN